MQKSPRAGRRLGRVSAVLVALWLYPWNLSRASLRLDHHPWTTYRYTSVLTRLPQAIPQAAE